MVSGKVKLQTSNIEYRIYEGKGCGILFDRCFEFVSRQPTCQKIKQSIFNEQPPKELGNAGRESLISCNEDRTKVPLFL